MDKLKKREVLSICGILRAVSRNALLSRRSWVRSPPPLPTSSFLTVSCRFARELKGALSSRYLRWQHQTEDANLNEGRVLVRMSRGGQAVPVSSVFDSYRESTKNVSEVPKHADELLVYDNTAHRRGFRVVAHFIGGKLSKTAQTIPDWAAEVFGKELRAAKQHEKSGLGR